MEKNFDKWNKLKKSLEWFKNKILFKEWDIWWTSIWVNIWEESCWKWEKFRRPVLVIKKLSSTNCIVIPLSSKIKTWTWFAQYKIHWIIYTALLYQIKMLNIKRFESREWQIHINDFNEIKKRLKNLLNL
jgi:mRNA interferase MazF